MKVYLILSILLVSICIVGFHEDLVINAQEGYPKAEIVSIDYPNKVLIGDNFTVEITIDHWTGGDIEGLFVCIQDEDEYQDPVPINAPWPKVRELRRFMPEGPDTDIFELDYQAPSYTDELSLIVEVYFFHRSTRSTTSERPVSHLEFGDSEIIEVDVVTSIQTPAPAPTTPEPTSAPSPTTTPTEPSVTIPETATPTETPSDTSELQSSALATNALLILVLTLVIIVLVFALLKPKSKPKTTKDKFCRKCGATIQKGYDFCNKCGTKIKRN